MTEQTFGEAAGAPDAPQDVTEDSSPQPTETADSGQELPQDQDPGTELTPEQIAEAERAEWEEQRNVSKKPWFKKRFDKMTYQRRQAERLADEATKRADQLQAALDQLAGRQQSPPQDAPIIPPPASVPKPVIDNFDSDAEYFEALSDWKLNDHLAKQKAQADAAKQQERERKRQEQAQSFNTWFQQKSAETMEAGEQSYMDWQKVVLPVINTNLPAGLGAEILQVENPSDVLYHVCKNPADLAKIMQIQSPVKRALELGKLDDKIQGAKKKGRVSNVPPIVAPVAGAKATPTRPDPKDTEAWIKARRAEKMKRR